MLVSITTTTTISQFVADRTNNTNNIHGSNRVVNPSQLLATDRCANASITDGVYQQLCLAHVMISQLKNSKSNLCTAASATSQAISKKCCELIEEIEKVRLRYVTAVHLYRDDRLGEIAVEREKLQSFFLESKCVQSMS